MDSVNFSRYKDKRAADNRAVKEKLKGKLSFAADRPYTTTDGKKRVKKYMYLDNDNEKIKLYRKVFNLTRKQFRKQSKEIAALLHLTDGALSVPVNEIKRRLIHYVDRNGIIKRKK